MTTKPEALRVLIADLRAESDSAEQLQGYGYAARRAAADALELQHAANVALTVALTDVLSSAAFAAHSARLTLTQHGAKQ